MAAFSKLRQDLEAIDRHLAEGRARIAQQAEVLCELDAEGHDTTDVQNLLGVLHQSLDEMNDHRQEIVHELSRTPDEPI